VSGGADSVALFRRLIEERIELGIVLSIAHVHHGIRGSAADADADFVAQLAAGYDVPFHFRRVDVPAEMALHHESLEEAARKLRYAFFEELIAQGQAAAVATAHTLDDQAETVLLKLIRGAWTEGFSGIHPAVKAGAGWILRPFLETTRASIEAWLRSLNQSWREDASNLDLTHTRNRIRHELLPQLSTYNPEIARQLARMAAISADEEHYWQGELDRLLPSLLLPGKPVRGGGRANSTQPGAAIVALELERLKQLPAAVARRVLRAAARQLGVSLGFDHTERLLALCNRTKQPAGSAGNKVALPGGMVAERSFRELRLVRGAPSESPAAAAPEYVFSIPGEVDAPEFGVSLRGEMANSALQTGQACTAKLRRWKAGDQVTLRHSRSPKKVKEVLSRLRILGAEREFWPVVESAGRIVWMRGVEVDAPEFVFVARHFPWKC
jgi:tRNA(Ile)-lysidine synthase